MPSPIQALAEYGRRMVQDEADKSALTHYGRGGRALLAPDRAAWESGKLQGPITQALAVITAALQQCQKPVISFSGGKDSTVVMALVHTINPSVPVIWSDDELEYPEIVSMMRMLSIVARREPVDAEFIWLQGGSTHAGWFRPWVDRPYFRDPDPRMTWLQDGQADTRDWLRDNGYDLTFLGTRMWESRRRRDNLLVRGPTYPVSGGTGTHCQPIWDWTEADVWALIAGWELPYSVVYDRLAELGVERHRQRIGPLPLARREDLEAGWSDLLTRLEARYGQHWA